MVRAGQSALAGERHPVTVLFSAILGSTALIRGLDAVKPQRLHASILQIMTDAEAALPGARSSLRSGQGTP